MPWNLFSNNLRAFKPRWVMEEIDCLEVKSNGLDWLGPCTMEQKFCFWMKRPLP